MTCGNSVFFIPFGPSVGIILVVGGPGTCVTSTPTSILVDGKCATEVRNSRNCAESDGPAG